MRKTFRMSQSVGRSPTYFPNDVQLACLKRRNSFAMGEKNDKDPSDGESILIASKDDLKPRVGRIG